MQKRVIIGLCLALMTLKLNAASFGTYRIYLDNKTPQDKFVVKNRTVFPEQCEVSFSYRQYTDNGQVVKLTEAEQASFSKSTLDRIRFSPRKFTIQPKSSQYVSFKYRRQINDNPAEYRTYVNFTCTAIKEKQRQAGVSFAPALVHAVPLVLRTAPEKSMMLNLSFLKTKKQGKTVSFRVKHAGDRSFVGDIHLMTENGTTLKTLQRNLALYPDMNYKDFSFSLGTHHNKNIKIVFQENSLYGGNELFELPLRGAY